MNETLTEELTINEATDTIVAGNKSIVTSALQLSLLGIAVGFCLFLYNGPETRTVQLSGFLILGCLYTIILEKKRASFGYSDVFIYALLLAVGIHLTLGLISYFINRFDLFFNLSFAVAFFLPSVILKTWKLYIAIPSIGPALWNYSIAPPAVPSFGQTKIPIGIEVKKSFMKPKVFFSDMPLEGELSTALYLTIMEQYDKQNAMANFLNEEGKPYNWIFYKKQLLSKKRYLQPHSTLFENGIKPNMIITAERLVDKTR